MADIKELPIETGSVVTLKSGGHAMTVVGFEPMPANTTRVADFPTEKSVRCVWMNDAGDIDEKLFWPHTLVVVEDEPETPANEIPALPPTDAPPPYISEQHEQH